MNNLIKGETGDWEVVIGIEVHAQIVSNSKLFSSASTKFGGEHNTQVSFVDAGMPGMLPVINWVCVEQACLLYTSPSPRDRQKSRMPSSA